MKTLLRLIGIFVVFMACDCRGSDMSILRWWIWTVVAGVGFSVYGEGCAKEEATNGN